MSSVVWFLLPPPRKLCNHRCLCLSVCLSVSNFAQKLQNGFAWKFQGRLAVGSMNKWLNFGGNLDHCLDTAIVFQIHHYWEIRKVVSTNCAARRCSAGHELAGIAIATMKSLCHLPTTDSHDRHALAEVCTVPLLVVFIVSWFRGHLYGC